MIILFFIALWFLSAGHYLIAPFCPCLHSSFPVL